MITCQVGGGGGSLLEHIWLTSCGVTLGWSGSPGSDGAHNVMEALPHPTRP